MTDKVYEAVMAQVRKWREEPKSETPKTYPYPDHWPTIPPPVCPVCGKKRK